MYPGRWAQVAPDRAAVIMSATGDTLTYRELDERSNRLAHFFRSSGLVRGDGIAMVMENHLAFAEVVWAAMRSGLYVTAVNWHLTVEEAAYIIDDCGAKILISTSGLSELVMPIDGSGLEHRLMVGDMIGDMEDLDERWTNYEDAVATQSTSPINDEAAGEALLYSSGTTGRPKGIIKPLPKTAPWELSADEAAASLRNHFNYDEDTVYLSPAPMYHAAPFRSVVRVHTFGGTAVIMDQFKPEPALKAIERYGITHSQWVPTMFIRMLELPAEVRAGYDLSSQRVAIHAAAPCPVDVKHQMMDWWGPTIYEYYAGSESVGITTIGPQEWLAHPGSVGRVTPGAVHILDENDEAVAQGEIGLIHFVPTTPFEYKGDATKTADATSKQGWVSYGDMGYVDADGYLFLTDRKSFMIISGGVNIYPREAEEVLLTHPAVADVAVFGVPNEALGEEAKAVVELQPSITASDALGDELLAYCRANLSLFKCPRSLDFENHLPRLPTGKLRKGDLRRRYWP